MNEVRWRQQATTRVSWRLSKASIGDDEGSVPGWLDNAGRAIEHALMARYYDRLDGVSDSETTPVEGDPLARNVVVRIPIELTREEWLDAIEDAMRANSTLSGQEHLVIEAL